MMQWTRDQLENFGRAEEVQIESLRRGGRRPKPVTTWVVRIGDDLYVRSVRGRSGHWFRAVQETHDGRIRARDIQHDVTFVDADHGVEKDIDDAYRAKYRRYSGAILDSVLTPEARSATLRVVPRSSS